MMPGGDDCDRIFNFNLLAEWIWNKTNFMYFMYHICAVPSNIQNTSTAIRPENDDLGYIFLVLPAR